MSGYSASARVLHALALGSPARLELAFDLEKRLFLRSAPRPDLDRHVFVQGLARAGTTILMRELHRTGVFGSLTYRDMPFVICCNLWAALTQASSRDIADKERAHGDGISVNADSPEALDEVFWRVFAGHDYLRKEGLQTHQPSPEMLEDFTAYIQLILRRTGRTRYLSKNNNNILRLPTLQRRFPNSAFLIPVRSPLQHAFSLLKQHRRFSSAENYTIKYMRWIGHHEFGATHRPFRFPDSIPLSGESPESLNYWLLQWLNVYTYLDRTVSAHPENAFFVPYEHLCGDTGVWLRIMQLVGLPPSAPTAFRESESEIDVPFDTAIHDRAEELYRGISRRALETLACVHGRDHVTVSGQSTELPA